MGDEWTADEAQDARRDVYALLRAFNASGAVIDDAVLAILDNADSRLLARLLLGVAHHLAVQGARLSGCTADDEIRDLIDKRLAELQAEILAGPDG